MTLSVISEVPQNLYASDIIGIPHLFFFFFWFLKYKFIPYVKRLFKENKVPESDGHISGFMCQVQILTPLLANCDQAITF